MERVTRAEAARQLGLDKATVTRTVKANPALLGDDGMVDLAELRAVRGATINPKLQTRGREGREPARESGREAGRETGPSLNESRERTEIAKAETAELDLAERLGLTLRRSDVENAIAAAADVMRQVAMQQARDKAERLTRIIDVREMERALEDMMRDVLTQSAQALTLAAAQPGSSQAA